jgi:hypothetical protein
MNKNTELQLTYSLEETIQKIGDYSHLLAERKEFNRINGFDHSKNDGGLLNEEKINEQEWLDNVQTFFDYAGIIPVVGDAIDVINAIISFSRASFEGKWVPHATNGLLSVIAIIPVVGSALAIPLKAVFKLLPVAALTKIMKSIEKGNDAAKLVTDSPKLIKIFEPVLKVIRKYKEAIAKGFTILKDIIKNSAVIPFTKVDNVIAKKIVQLLKYIEDFILGIARKSTKGNLFKQIPFDKLTKQGRIKLPNGSRILRNNRKRAFYATQDMFKDDLVKQITKGSLKLTPELSTMLAQSARRVGSESGVKALGSNKKLQREFSNVVMANTNYLETFLKNPSFKMRTERFLRTVDPSVVKDTRGFFSYLKKSMYSLITAKVAKDYKEPEEYRKDREQDTYRKEQNILDKDKKGDHYGKLRNA